jgi:hypothetical protein
LRLGKLLHQGGSDAVTRGLLAPAQLIPSPETRQRALTPATGDRVTEVTLWGWRTNRDVPGYAHNRPVRWAVSLKLRTDQSSPNTANVEIEALSDRLNANGREPLAIFITRPTTPPCVTTATR